MKLFAVLVSMMAVLIAPAQTTRSSSRPATRPAVDTGITIVEQHAARVVADREFTIPAAPEPRLLVVRLRRENDACDATLSIDDGAIGRASQFEYAPRATAASLVVPPNEPRRLRVHPAKDGVVLESIVLQKAARIRFTVRDQASKDPIPGIVTVAAIDGAMPPLSGAEGDFPREGPAFFSGDGFGEVYVPLHSGVTFVARSHPFRGVSRQYARIDIADGLLLNFLLPQDQLPAGAHIIEAAARAHVSALSQKSFDHMFGIGRRADDARILDGATLTLEGPRALIDALTASGARALVTNELGPRLASLSQHPLVTVELADGSLVHSNGPMPLIEDLHREGEAVKMFVKVHLPAGCNADELRISTGPLEERHPLSGPTTVPLVLSARAGTTIVLTVVGSGFDGAAIVERPIAVRMITAP